MTLTDEQIEHIRTFLRSGESAGCLMCKKILEELTPSAPKLDGWAIFGKLKEIDSDAGDLVVVDQMLHSLIEDIKRGEYNLPCGKEKFIPWKDMP